MFYLNCIVTVILTTAFIKLAYENDWPLAFLPLIGAILFLYKSIFEDRTIRS